MPALKPMRRLCSKPTVKNVSDTRKPCGSQRHMSSTTATAKRISVRRQTRAQIRPDPQAARGDSGGEARTTSIAYPARGSQHMTISAPVGRDMDSPKGQKYETNSSRERADSPTPGGYRSTPLDRPLWRPPSLTCGDSALPSTSDLVRGFHEHPTNQATNQQGVFMKRRPPCSRNPKRRATVRAIQPVNRANDTAGYASDPSTAFARRSTFP
jgi:hypothetical protein